MKCPNCRSLISSKDLENKTESEIYRCPKCESLSAPRFGLIGTLILGIVVAPIIEIPIQAFFELTFYNIAKSGEDWPRTLSIVCTFAVVVIAYIFLRKLVPFKRTSEVESAELNKRN